MHAYDKAIELNPEFAEAWDQKGDLLKAQAKYDEAINAYEEAISMQH